MDLDRHRSSTACGRSQVKNEKKKLLKKNHNKRVCVRRLTVLFRCWEGQWFLKLLGLVHKHRVIIMKQKVSESGSDLHGRHTF